MQCQHPDGCDRPVRGRGWCAAHYMRFYTKGDVGPAEIGLPANLSPGRRGADNARWAGNGVTYSGAHIRVRTQRGRASEHQCEHCDAQAQHWAYDHTDPDDLQSPRGERYSADPAHYLPLCVSCHNLFDENSVKAWQTRRKVTV